MRYMLLIYTREDEERKASAEAMQAVAAGHMAATATTVRMRDGKALTTDGPFAETKEQLAGYYILTCRDLDEAIEWAARIPTACGGNDGCVEIRPLRGRSGHGT